MNLYDIMQKEYPSYEKLVRKYKMDENLISEFYENNEKVTLFKNLWTPKIISDEVYEVSVLLETYQFEYAEVEAIIGEIQGSLAIEGVFSSRKLIDQVKDKNSFVKDEDTQNIYNIFQCFEFIKQSPKINEENIKKLYDMLTKDIELKTNTLYSKTYRKDEVVIESSTGKTIAKGVDCKNVEKFMNNFIDDINSFIDEKEKDNDAILYLFAAMIHYQFVFIHPYYDRNGRMARLISQWFLFNVGVTNIIPISEIIKYEKNKYNESIQNVRDSYTKNDVTYFIKYMIEATHRLLDAKIRVSKYRDLLINDDIILTESEEKYIVIILLKYKNEKFDHKKFGKLLNIYDKKRSKEGNLKILNKLEQQNVLSSHIKNKTKIFYLKDEILELGVLND